ncbi:serine protease AprX [Evansella caseinilytica]|uniref:Serine protease AprX n=1 Tax=Evansella caseinilytica TaxID=1503961 RepID=A0A1H3RI44_9BACI|nr:S8 family peptidase [Evansella caseinilytica]SDZ25367.1 serine protease AprX [Evansella caseinilytica]
MFGYSMIQMIRTHADRVDRHLRQHFLSLYRPFKWMPCFLHRLYDAFLKKTKRFSVIIQFKEAESSCIQEGVEMVHDIVHRHMRCELGKEFTAVNCCCATVTAEALEELLANCNQIKKVHYNREVRALLDVATPAVHADNVIRNNTTLTGAGVTIAVIDTGIYPHEDLDGRIIGFQDFINHRAEPYDDNGHGTHCAGDAAGSGAQSAGNYKGPAENAFLVGVKVLNKLGSGSLQTVMYGVQWCIENKDAYGIDIISMSLGSPANPSYPDEDDDPMVQIVEAAWHAGIVVIAAAGNDGPDSNTIASPGISDKIITVGAMDDRGTIPREDDDIAVFSSRGPTIYGVSKPDVVAPGVNIISLRAPNSYLDKLQKAARVDGDYIMLSGTSMATPICAGVAALLLEYDKSYTPDEVKNLLMENAEKWGNDDQNVYGSGYIHAENTIPSG